MLKQLTDQNKYLICASLSTFSLIFTSISIISISKSIKEVSSSMDPISKWAEIQNKCIEKTTAFEGISNKVWSCNGGGD